MPKKKGDLSFALQIFDYKLDSIDMTFVYPRLDKL